MILNFAATNPPVQDSAVDIVKLLLHKIFPIIFSIELHYYPVYSFNSPQNNF